jgi:transcription elongation factor Elf1
MRDYSEFFKDKAYPCPLCEQKTLIKVTNKDKYGKNKIPYIVCNDCGVQMFIRYDKGIERLKNRLDSFWL